MTIKDAKKNFIIDVACKLFLENSINDITIRDIAKTAGVGEATVYRYFEHKRKIVIAVAEKLQLQVYTEFFYEKTELNGYKQLETFYGNYADIFVSNLNFYQFVKEFDAYMLSDGQGSSDNYSSGMDLYKRVFFNAYECGIKDGSVKVIDNPELFYFSTTHAMLELCKKLATNKNVVKQDLTIDKVAEIYELIKVILSYIANPQA